MQRFLEVLQDTKMVWKYYHVSCIESIWDELLLVSKNIWYAEQILLG